MFRMPPKINLSVMVEEIAHTHTHSNSQNIHKMPWSLISIITLWFESDAQNFSVLKNRQNVPPKISK
jgi:hypothetical protein